MWGWLNRWKARRRRFQAAARQLVIEDEARAYYEAQRRAALARVNGDRGEFWHWAATAAEVARISNAPMDLTEVERVATAVYEQSR